MSASTETQSQQQESKPTGYIAIGLRETERGLRLVRLFTTDTLPREFSDDAPTVN